MRASLGGGLIRDWEGKSWCMRVDRHVVGVSGAVCVTLGFQEEKIGFVCTRSWNQTVNIKMV